MNGDSDAHLSASNASVSVPVKNTFTESIPGYPLFNMTECVLYLLNILQERGFSCRYVDGYIIYITWKINKKEYKAIEDKKDTLNNIHLKYKHTEGNSFKNFIPRKKF